MATWAQELLKTTDPSAFIKYVKSIVGTIQGPIGPPGPAGGGAVTYTSQNKDSINLTTGTPVTEDVSGSGFVRANATNNSKPCFGLLSQNINQTISGTVQLTGPLFLADWTAVIGAVSLTPRGKYFLSTTAGRLTTTAPNTPGQITQLIGYALDAQTLSITIGNPILL